MENQLVVFKLADENYGVSIASVESIIKLQAITKVPHAPKFVEGVTNLRGTVIPVMDLRKRFGLPYSKDTNETRIVVVELNGLMVGMIVDAVTEVLRVSEEAIEPPSALVATLDAAFITGIAKVGQRLVIFLDLTKVLSHEEQPGLQAVSAVA